MSPIMLPHLFAILGFALLCGGWVLLQRWITRSEPGVKGPESGCGSCSGREPGCEKGSPGGCS